ncbi:MAG: GNAT family N-acetyltransferase [Candidatus Cohnella colombiensis]|uniref:GNAT family N-acetyltransferase n=1 Tax=Candidatus Cohnella colombiensis TaxID=3121368 RepID=A0AA95JH29_9BACL|nr:MAG: GNAT family N-acetyltransferase [Cohnella sp.]
MLIDITSRLNEPEIQELISYAVFPDPEQLNHVIAQYQSVQSGQEIFGYTSDDDEDDQTIIGIIGSILNDQKVLTIQHIAVLPEDRGKGYGRGMILELLHMKQPTTIVAETDEEAVQFYRSIGFTIASLGEVYAGVERFQCSYEVDDEE